MAEEKEILKYELDITDVESKTARLVQLQEQIKEKRGKGEDSSEVEKQFAREAVARM